MLATLGSFTSSVRADYVVFQPFYSVFTLPYMITAAFFVTQFPPQSSELSFGTGHTLAQSDSQLSNIVEQAVQALSTF